MFKQLFLLALITVLAVSEVTYEDNVAVLTSNNFDEFIKQNEFVLVEFYAPWCGHCKQLAPEYSAAAAKLQTSDPAVPLAKVDATVNETLAEKFQIQGYPTLIWFVSGNNSEYSGPREQEGIVAWVKKRSGPVTQEIKSVDAFNKIRSDNEAIFVLFSDNKESIQVFETVAKQNEIDIIDFYTVSDAQVRKEAEVPEGKDTLVLFKNYDDGRVNFTGEKLEVEAIITFLKKNAYPVIMTFNEASAEIIFSSEKSTLFLIVNQSEKSDSALQALNQAKDAFKDRLLIAKSVISEGLGERLGEYLNLQDSDLPRAIIFKMRGEDIDKYYLEGEITEQSILEFVVDFIEDRLKPTLMSEEIPETNNELVKVVVSKNFHEFVYNNGKDVLVKFYAPWCGHCKEMIPAYEKVAQVYENDEKVVIAKMDYTKNEVADLEIQGFPTLLFFSAEAQTSKDQISYEGERNEKEIIKFIEANRKTKNVKKEDL